MNVETSLNDQLSRLLVRTGEGDQKAFESLINRTMPQLRKICLSFCNDEVAADEVFQDTIISVWRHARTFRPAERRALPWLITVTRSRALDWSRNKAFQDSVAALISRIDIEDRKPEPLQFLLERERDALLYRSLDLIDCKKRESIMLHYLDGLSSTCIANVLKCASPTIKSRINRGVRDLRKVML